MAQINLRVDDNLKSSAERTLNDIGLSMSTAINIFLKTVVRENRIPFELSADPLQQGEHGRTGKTCSGHTFWQEHLERA